LYISEDQPNPFSLVLRVDDQGIFRVFATGFGQAQGMAFDPANGDLYIAEQDFSRVWRVVFGPPLHGDYNRNGAVDAADYIAWRRGFTSSGLDLAADGNRDGQIDLDDNELWRRSFGRIVPGPVGRGAAPVPEPAAWVMCMGIMVMLNCRRASVLAERLGFIASAMLKYLRIA
jgi:hypothetical protein